MFLTHILTYLKRAIAITGITLLTSSCSTTKPPKGSIVIFETRISSNNLKHFQLKIKNEKREKKMTQPRRNDQSRSGNRESGRDRNEFDKKQALLRALAEIEIQKNQYCRTGFWEIENAADARIPYIRGECNEAATEEDRKNFAHDQLVW